MKVFAVAAIVIALYLLYKISRTENKAAFHSKEDIPEREKPDTENVVGKSRYVPASQSQAAQTLSSKEENKIPDKKADIFALENKRKEREEKPEEAELLDIEVPLDSEPEDWDGETEELQEIFEGEPQFAGGLTYEEMTEAVSKEDKPEILRQLSKTDMFEQLIFQDKAKAERIRKILDSYENET